MRTILHNNLIKQTLINFDYLLTVLFRDDLVDLAVEEDCGDSGFDWRAAEFYGEGVVEFFGAGLVEEDFVEFLFDYGQGEVHEKLGDVDAF